MNKILLPKIFSKKIFSPTMFSKKKIHQKYLQKKTFAKYFSKKKGGVEAPLLPAGPRLLSSDSEIAA